jgi:predicted transcriptional regulator
MLKVAQEGATRVTIMYGCYLSTHQLRKYLGLLTDHGLLQYDKKDNKFRLTERGRDFIIAYEELDRLINDD